MRKTKWLAAFFLPLLLVSFLQSQNLADLAKKEKARRAALKGKSATVITTADLAKAKRRPAVESTNQEQAAEGTGEAAQAAGIQGQAQEGVTPPATVEQGQAAATETQAIKPADAQKPAETPPAEAPPLSDKDYRARQAELSKAAQDKQELLDLLTLKMNSLYQEFYALDSVKSREMLQAQISDTYDKLLKTEIEAKQAAKDLEDFLAQTKKDQTPAIWIK
jgi:hypothetical protein